MLRGVLFGLGSWSNFRPFVAQRTGSMPLSAGLAIALVAAFYSFGGWWDVSKIAGEVKDPQRTLPRALVIGVLCVATAYILVSGVFLYLVPLEKVASDEGFVAQAGEVLFGGGGAKLLAGAVVVCVFGSLAVLLMAAPRVYYAMAKDGLFFSKVAVPHPKFGTPWRAIVIQTVLASILVVLGSFNQIISYFIFVAVLFIGLTVSSIFRLRRSGGGQQNYVPALGYPYTPIFFLMLTVPLLALMLMHNFLQALIGIAVVAAGLPIYALMERKRNLESKDVVLSSEA
jgi:APA family basic amino acid/polyamine antiporter